MDERYGVMLMNFGGPADLAQVEPFIQAMLSDPLVVALPLGSLWQGRFAHLVARRRAPVVRERYRLIGGFSPVVRETQTQARALEARLDLPVEAAMRYTQPSVEAAFAALAGRGVTRTVLLPLYPQYGFSSSRSSIEWAQQHTPEGMALSVIPQHHDHDGYIAALANGVERTLAGVPAGLRTHLLCAAHSIPVSYTRRGDPYVPQMERTARLLGERLAGRVASWSLAYQSAVGPARWHGPSLEEELSRLRTEGVEALVVTPLSFTAENLETLYDLDIVFAGQCTKRGLAVFRRVPTLSADPAYMDALKSLVTPHLGASTHA